MTEQRFVFGEVAEQYDRFRPGYPDALVERVLAHARLPMHGRILEIGCGTGKATQSFAERGHAITCLEPSPQMAAVALSNLERFARVEIVVETFEDWPLPERPFQLALSAQAFHWIDPAQRYSKVARALQPGGLLAVMFHMPLQGDGPIRKAIDRAYAECAPELAAREPGSAPRSRSLIDEFAAAEEFSGFVCEAFPWSRNFSASEYVGLLCTQSDHAMLPAPIREALLGRIEASILDAGGYYGVNYVAHLLMATRSAR